VKTSDKRSLIVDVYGAEAIIKSQFKIGSLGVSNNKVIGKFAIH
jgi:hypothetical protein